MTIAACGDDLCHGASKRGERHLAARLGDLLQKCAGECGECRLAADVAGFSRLMGDDEEGTLDSWGVDVPCPT